MKLAMGALGVILAVVTTATAAENSAVREQNWKCDNQKGLVVSAHVGATVTGTLLDKDFAEGLLTLVPQVTKNGDAKKLTVTSYQYLDVRDYSVELVPVEIDSFTEFSSAKSATGKAVVIEQTFMDCLGESGSVEVLDCQVELR
jgi:hypothetical protein